MFLLRTKYSFVMNSLETRWPRTYSFVGGRIEVKIIVCMMVCERDATLARLTLLQILSLLEKHDVEVLLFDDASPSFVGSILADSLRQVRRNKVHVKRCDSPRGYYRLPENFMDMLGYAATQLGPFDYLLRTDPDVHFCGRGLESFFDVKNLPSKGVVSPIFRMRTRDLILYLGDLLPLGFRRRRRNGGVEHAWEFAGQRQVWWADFGRRALRNGYRGEVTPGAFLLIAWETLQVMNRAGIFARDHSQIGLVFLDDVLIGILTRSFGHPVIHPKELFPSWSSDVFLKEDTTPADIRRQGHLLIHPLKDKDWCHALRAALPLLPSVQPDCDSNKLCPQI